MAAERTGTPLPAGGVSPAARASATIGGNPPAQDTDSDTPSSLTAADQKLLANRERWRLNKRQERERKAEERNAEAMQLHPSGYVVPDMPAGLSRIRKWYRDQHNAFSRRQLHASELKVCADSMRVLADSYRAGADLRRARAMERSAIAQARMADVLASVEHGGAAVLMLRQMQEGLLDGKRKPLPGRAVAMIPPRTNGDPAA